MDTSKVFWTDMRCSVGDSLLNKLARLMKRAGADTIDFNKKFVAIKIHFGEPGNLAYLRPNFAKTVADFVKKKGGLPFLTDCNTLYVGRRNNAIVHLDAASENGFSSFTTGCQNIIADGIRGTDDIEIKINGGIYCKTALIGRAIMDADIFISLNHFKGHELTGFGGAIKNIGMGSGSRGGKMVMHNAGKPHVEQANCVGCRVCSKFCNAQAIEFNSKGKAKINHDRCVGCGRCIGACNHDAIEHNCDESNDVLNYKMAEYAKAVIDGRPNFHVNIINHVSPNCDCHGENDAAIIPDIGIFASFDPVALDNACIDMANAAPEIPTSAFSESTSKTKGDHFCKIHPKTNWRGQISHAEKIGLGNSKYELVKIK